MKEDLIRTLFHAWLAMDEQRSTDARRLGPEGRELQARISEFVVRHSTEEQRWAWLERGEGR